MATKMTTIEISLSDKLATDAREFGLLEPTVIVGLIEEAVRQRHVKRLSAAMDKMAGMGDAPMSPEEIQREIRASRATKRAARV